MLAQAESLNAARNWAAAETLYRLALEWRRGTHAVADEAVIGVMNALAWVVRQQGRFEEAADLYREMISAQSAAYGANSPAVAYTLASLGWNYSDRQQHNEGMRYMEEALRVFQQAHHTPHSDLGYAHHCIAVVSMRQHQFAAAHGAFERSVAAYLDAGNPQRAAEEAQWVVDHFQSADYREHWETRAAELRQQ